MVKYVEIKIVALVLAAACAVTASAECDKTKCKGPLKYYDELACKPIYENEGDCCAVAYNCDHLKRRSKNKCYHNGEEYEVGETVRNPFSNPCVAKCTCTATRSGVRFLCNLSFCEPPSVSSEDLACYMPRNALTCCSKTSICVKPENLPTCNVSGSIYKAGEFFIPPGERHKRCYCNKGYKGENVAPFCRIETGHCHFELIFPREIINNNPPIYLEGQSRLEACSMLFRYSDKDDQVIKLDGTAVAISEHKSASQAMQCKFENITLNVGEKLSPIIFSNINFIVCKCEVPPALTCTGTRMEA